LLEAARVSSKHLRNQNTGKQQEQAYNAMTIK
jgi:hypothetical protein